MTIAAALIFKDSATYLDEWLRWHGHQGIERFYLYDNGSSDDWREAVGHLIGPLGITVIDWPGTGQQLAAYYDALLRAQRDEIDWLAFIDDDEFLLPTEPGDTLEQILPDYSYAAGLAVPWIPYGSAGQEHRTEGWVTERFLFRTSLGIDPHVKCIVQPRRIVAPLVSGHHFQTVAGGPPMVTEDHRPIDAPHDPAPTAARVRLHHYLVKSWDEWRVRRGRLSVDGLSPEHSESQWREWDLRWSGTYDSKALRYTYEILGRGKGSGFRVQAENPTET